MSTELNQQDTTGLAAAAAAVISAATSRLSDGIAVPIALEPTSIADEIPSPGVEDVWVEIPLAGTVAGMTRLIVDGADVGAIVSAVKPDHSDDAPLDEDALAALAETMTHFAGGVATALSDGLGGPVEAGQTTASLQRQSDPDSGTVVVTYAGTIAGADDVEVFWLIEPPVAAAIRDSWGAANEAESPPVEPRPAPAAPAPPSPAVAPSVPGGGVIDTVELDIAVELGNVAMTIGELLHMGEGSVVTLTQAVGDKVVMLANGTAVASGEVVVVDGTLGFRVAELITEAPGA